MLCNNPKCLQQQCFVKHCKCVIVNGKIIQPDDQSVFLHEHWMRHINFPFSRLFLKISLVLVIHIPFYPQITYSLLSDSSGDHLLFRIEPKFGIIYTEAIFDREARSSYLLEVQSVDGQESARPGKNKQPNSGKEFYGGIHWILISRGCYGRAESPYERDKS